MPRLLLCSVTLLAFAIASASAQNPADKKTDRTEKDKSTAQGNKKNAKEATITKVDAKKGTITVQMNDKNGKSVEKTFTLTEDVRMLDSTGRVAAVDVFQSGNEVLIIEQEGKLRELHKTKGGANTNAREKSK